MLLTNFVLYELVPINFVFYFKWLGSNLDTEAIFIHLLQSARAQGSGEEEEKEDSDEGKSDVEDADESNKEGSNSSKETDFSKLTYLTSIDICCSWDSSLADGKLTYKIEYDGDVGARNASNKDNNNNSDLQLKKAVIAAIEEWNTKVQNLELIDISTITPNSLFSSKEDVDIEVKFVQDVSGAGFEAGGRGQIAGVTTTTHDKDGFINKSTITLPKTAFYVEKQNDLEAFASSQYSSQLKEVAIHEIGHALGLGHANFEGDIMNGIVSYDGTTSISDCDIQAVSEANHWKLLYNTTTPINPTITNVNC
jgi:predicted Zn-dependent protease